MRIIFVRHGHPNYEKDCLTDLGVLHAKAVAQRLKNENDCFYCFGNICYYLFDFKHFNIITIITQKVNFACPL